MLGAGDVKLLVAIGALMGPTFTLWTLLGTALAGGALGLVYAWRRGALESTLQNAGQGAQVFRITRSAASLKAVADGSTGRMPYAPAIALGAALAAWLLRGRFLP
jgi:prepilin peptidase CpaA